MRDINRKISCSEWVVNTRPSECQANVRPLRVQSLFSRPYDWTKNDAFYQFEKRCPIPYNYLIFICIINRTGMFSVSFLMSECYVCLNHALIFLNFLLPNLKKATSTIYGLGNIFPKNKQAHYCMSSNI